VTEALGDSLAGLIADLTQQDIDQFFTDPKGLRPQAYSEVPPRASSTTWDASPVRPALRARQNPVCAAAIVRETHASESRAGEIPKLQGSVSFSDGFGREIQRKVQAEPGPVTLNGPF